MPLNFPASPTNGQYYNGFVWNAANETWDSAFAPRAATIPISSPNVVINGAFDIWQRGISISPASGYGYGADRWRIFSYAANSSTLARQTFTPGSAPTADREGEFFMRVTSTNNRIYLTHPVENVRTFAGQTVTLSFWAKAAATHAISVGLAQNFGSGGSTEVTTATQNFSVTTSWQRFSATFSLPSISGKTIGANNYLELIFIGVINNALDLWGVQLEAGIAATDFRRNANSIQGELAACQRYFQRFGGNATNERIGNGSGIPSTRLQFIVRLSPEMRVPPTSTPFSDLIAWDGSASIGISSVNSATFSTDVARFEFNGLAAATSYRPYELATNTINSYLDFVAEL